MQVLHGAVAPSDYRSLDGLAIVSDIMASAEPLEKARNLSFMIKSFKSLELPPIFSSQISTTKHDLMSVVNKAGKLLESVRNLSPLVHQVGYKR